MWWGGSEFTSSARGCLRAVFIRAYCFVVPWCCVCIYVVYEMVPGATATRQRFVLVGHRRWQIGRGGRLTAMIYDACGGHSSCEIRERQWKMFAIYTRYLSQKSSTYDAWASLRWALMTRYGSMWVHPGPSRTLRFRDLCVSDVVCPSSSEHVEEIIKWHCLIKKIKSTHHHRRTFFCHFLCDAENSSILTWCVSCVWMWVGEIYEMQFGKMSCLYARQLCRGLKSELT